MPHWWKNKKPAEHLQFWLQLFTSLSEIYNLNNIIKKDFWHIVNYEFSRILSILVEEKKHHGKQKKPVLKRAFCTMMTMVNMGWEMGFEPTIFGTTIRRFNQLSYTHHVWRALLDSNQWLTA